MGHVDALSRHVGSFAHGDKLNRENILKGQEKDAFCNKKHQELIRGIFLRKRRYFIQAQIK
jgi:hypothetical protein